MNIYFLVFVVTLLIQFVPVKGNNGYLKRVIITFIPMFLYGALRVDFGFDYPSYESEFYLAHLYSDIEDVSEHSEIGYVLLEKIIPTWRLLIIITSAMTCVAYGFVFYKCVPPTYSWLAIILLFLAGDKTIFFQFSGIRNAIAIAIMYMSITFVRDKKWMPFFLLTAVAFSMHTSAILMMPLVFFLCSGKDMSKREAVFWIVAMLVLQVTSLNSFYIQMTDIVSRYLDRYTSYAELAVERGDNRSFLIRGTIAVFIILTVIFMRKNKLTKEMNVVCRLSLLFVFSFLLSSLNYRMPQYFGFAFVCGSTILISKWRGHLARYLYLALTFLFLFYSFYIVFMGMPDFPYQIYNSVFG